MVRYSRMLELGTPAPSFRLPDPEGRMHALEDFGDASALLVAFICNHCPYVKHILPAFAQFARDYQQQGLAVVAISSNDVDSHPDDAPPRMAEVARAHGFVFPYLYDERQQAALTYQAVCTPDFFLFDSQRRLAYRGQFDGSRPRSNQPATGADLRAAVDAVLAGKPGPAEQTPSAGCSIKWKPQNEPEWA